MAGAVLRPGVRCGRGPAGSPAARRPLHRRRAGVRGTAGPVVVGVDQLLLLRRPVRRRPAAGPAGAARGDARRGSRGGYARRWGRRGRRGVRGNVRRDVLAARGFVRLHRPCRATGRRVLPLVHGWLGYRGRAVGRVHPGARPSPLCPLGRCRRRQRIDLGSHRLCPRPQCAAADLAHAGAVRAVHDRGARRSSARCHQRHRRDGLERGFRRHGARGVRDRVMRVVDLLRPVRRGGHRPGDPEWPPRAGPQLHVRLRPPARVRRHRCDRCRGRARRRGGRTRRRGGPSTRRGARRPHRRLHRDLQRHWPARFACRARRQDSVGSARPRNPDRWTQRSSRHRLDRSWLGRAGAPGGNRSVEERLGTESPSA